MSEGLVVEIVVFVLAAFVGFEIITKVPPQLHTPLMSGSNGISGVTIIGAILVAGAAHGRIIETLGIVAIALAMTNCVGGFLVTDRMLQMFGRKKKARDEGAAK